MPQTKLAESDSGKPKHSHCMRCNRKLKTDRSMSIGFGSICAVKAAKDAMAAKAEGE